MKQQDIHQQSLYQQFLDELESGAREYDRIMAAGENPGARRKAKRVLRRYAAVACLCRMAPALAWMLWPKEGSVEVRQPVVKVAQTKPVPAPCTMPEKTQEAKEEVPDRLPQQKRLAATPKEVIRTSQGTGRKAGKPVPDVPEVEQEKLDRLREHTEAEVQRLLLECLITLEVTKEIQENTEENHQLPYSI